MPTQVNGLTPTWSDSAWYKEQKNKERVERFATQNGVVGTFIQDGIIRLRDTAVDFINENGDHPAARLAGDVINGFGHLDYMVTEGAKLTPGGQGEVAKQSLEITEFATGLAPLAKTAAKQAPDVIRAAAKAGAKDIQSLGVGQATVATIQKGIDNLPPPAPKPVMVAMSPDGTLQLTNLPDKRVRGGDVFETTIDQGKFGVPGVDFQDIHKQYPEVEINFEKAMKYLNQPGGLRKFNEYISRTPDFKRQPFDPVAYYKHIRGKGLDMDEFRRVDFEQPVGKTGFRKMEQHHLFPVGESGPFMERMHQLKKAGIGDADDPVAMMMYADFLGASMGHRWTNMLNMHKIPHLKVHAEDLVVESKVLREKLAKINNTNDLMQEMHNHIIDRILPAKGKALDLQIEYLQKNPKLGKKLLEEAQTLRKAFKKQIQPKQLSAIDEYIQALRSRGASSL
tara:strand:+ start:85 stop:1440 length:1356 start_codon:yes stop_codon:yes gene_type:complete